MSGRKNLLVVRVSYDALTGFMEEARIYSSPMLFFLFSFQMILPKIIRSKSNL